MNDLKKVLLSAFFIVFVTPSLHSTASDAGACPQLKDFTSSQIQTAKVKWLVDGDTLHTDNGRKLRLLNINAPELNPRSKKPAEHLAKHSQLALSKLAPKGSTIYWTFDKLATDRYQRELALVFNQQGKLINQELVALGLAHALLIPPNVSYWRCFKQAQTKASKDKLGLWQDPKQFKIDAKNITNQNNFQWVAGRVTKVINSKKYRWVVLDNHLWVGIKRKDFKYFREQQLQFKIESRLSLLGYLYQSYGKNRVNLRHPAMLLSE